MDRVNLGCHPSRRTDMIFLGTGTGGPRRGPDDKEYPTGKEIGYRCLGYEMSRNRIEKER